MGDVSKWVLQDIWAGLAVGAAAGFAIAAALTRLLYYFRIPDNADSTTASLLQPERQQMLLFCGDAKALADLAIQRHMSDNLFLQRLSAQPCYKVLYAHFSEDFRHQIAEGLDNGKERSLLATACRNEIERLERHWHRA